MKELKQHPRTLMLIAMIVGVALLAVVIRFIPTPMNFAPVGALALFGGAMLSQRWLAFVVPLVAMLVGDVMLAIFVYGPEAFTAMPFVYASLILIVGLGRLLHGKRRDPLLIGGATLAGSVIFFLVTNFGSWLGPMYPPTLGGLWASYVAGLPFFHPTLISDAVFVVLLFGGFAVLERYVPRLNGQLGVADEVVAAR